MDRPPSGSKGSASRPRLVALAIFFLVTLALASSVSQMQRQPGDLTGIGGLPRDTYRLTMSVLASTGPASIVVVPSVCSVVVGGSKTFSATASDINGTPLTNLSLDWSVTVGSGSVFKSGDLGQQAVFIAGLTVGVSIVTASAGSVNASAVVTVIAGSPQSIHIAPSDSSLQVGTTQGFNASITDLFGNAIRGVNVSWSSTVGSIDQSGLLTTGTVAGIGEVRASYSGLEARAEITILPGVLHNVTVSPSSLELQPEDDAVITATARDVYGNAIPNVEFLWSTNVGKLMPIGGQDQMMFQAGSAIGTGTVTIQSGSETATVSVKIDPGPLASLVISPAVVVLGPGEFVDLEAKAFDAFGNEVLNANFEWSSTGDGDWSLSLKSESLAAIYSGSSGGNAIITVTVGTKSTTLVVTITGEPTKQMTPLVEYLLALAVIVLGGSVAILTLLLRRKPDRPREPPEPGDISPPAPPE